MWARTVPAGTGEKIQRDKDIQDAQPGEKTNSGLLTKKKGKVAKGCLPEGGKTREPSAKNGQPANDLPGSWEREKRGFALHR